MDKPLTPREIQILGCLKRGLPNKLIAFELKINEGTVKEYMNRLTRKIGMNRTMAGQYFLRKELAGWIDKYEGSLSVDAVKEFEKIVGLVVKRTC